MEVVVLKSRTRLRIVYAGVFLALLLTEVLISLFVHDSFIRPYVGDVLVVAVLYFLVRSIEPERVRLLPLLIFFFAAGVEALQGVNIVGMLGLESCDVMRIAIGSTFDWMDILCYAIGCLLLGLYELLRYLSTRHD